MTIAVASDTATVRSYAGSLCLGVRVMTQPIGTSANKAIKMSQRAILVSITQLRSR
jgi:hypothetical protein